MKAAAAKPAKSGGKPSPDGEPHHETDLAKDRGADRRIAPRHLCDGFAEVVASDSGSLFRGAIADLSEVGCFVKTRARPNIHRSSEADLQFTVKGENFSLRARVAMVNFGSGIGFEFSLIEPEMHRSLLLLIQELNSRKSQP